MTARSAASSATALWRDPEFVQGARDMASLSLGISSWALVTGVAMAKSELGPWFALLMSFVVLAGSAQLAALPLIATGAPLWVTLATGFCVNLRFLIFSAQWRPYFTRFSLPKRLLLGYFATDMTYVLFMKRYPDPQPGPGQIAYFAGGAVVNWLAWQIPSVIGIFLADVVPTRWGLGFAGTMALLGMTYSLIFDKTTGISAAVAGAAAVAAYSLPFKLNIVVAIAAAVAAGLVIERVERSRRPRVTLG